MTYDRKTGRWAVDFERMRSGIRSLTAELVILEGEGDNTKVKQFFDRWAVLTPELENSLAVVEDLPIDVLPNYSIVWD